MRKVRKIGIFALGDAGWQGGIQYISNLLHALDAISSKEKFEIYLFKKESQIFPDVKSLSNVNLYELPVETCFRTKNIFLKLWWKCNEIFFGNFQLRYIHYFKSNQFDFVFPSNISSDYEQINSASWIADFQYHHFPNGASKSVTAKAEKLISGIAHKSKKIVLSSHYCEKDCHTLFPITIGKTFVMSFSVFIDPSNLLRNDFSEIREKYSLPDYFFVVSNLFAPTKNHKVIFDAMGLLKKRGVEVHLVCTGNIVDYRNEGYANEILHMISENKIRNQVHLLGLIPREDQLSIFRMSMAMLQPSVNEGWSTSVEEAKALGKDILTSDIEVHNEQIPDNPYIFSSFDASELASKMESIHINAKGMTFPEMERETVAFSGYQKSIIEFGNRFIEIAQK